MKRFPLVTAHSGCMNEPINSLEALEAGLNAGADIVEDDIRATRDGMLVLSHDDELHAADGSVRSIAAANYETLRALELNGAVPGKTRRLADLASALTLVKSSGKTMNLDVKSDDALEPMAALIRRNDLTDSVFLSGCESARAQLAQRIFPEAPKLLNANARLFLDSPVYADAVRQTIEEALAASCFGINIAYRLIRPELLEAAAAAELPVFAWTIDDEAQMKEALGMNLRSITTRNVEALLRLKAAHVRDGSAG
ncbi:glycerophosphodiester phosphodiesterase [Paenibacillus humicola]|uniref:glycerophosphodiester phosphodiesterase n=1 Tax=Paenibacillus humicola TaxID=3110540 RepID=UPI00237A515D|nr:glycerophosphodiester phosphodiesterase [Paenibacillus humicola]